MSNDDTDRELDRLIDRLPEILRDEWVVLPRHSVLQISIVCLLLGSAGTLLVLGFVLDMPALRWAWPAVVVGLMAAARFWPWWRGDHQLEQLRRSGEGRDIS